MGCLLGHAFGRAGYDVSLIDIPARVAQLSAKGTVTLIEEDGSESTAGPFRISSEYGDLGRHDIVVLATKAQHLPAVADKIGLLRSPGSTIVTIQNGIPWWYLRGLPAPYGDRPLRCLDPYGTLERSIDPASIVGCVAYPAVAVEPDGRIRHGEGRRFSIGELDGHERDRTRRLAELFEHAGYKSRIIEDIRSEIWLKAWGALSINPISALTRATMEEICSYAETKDLVALMMREAQDVAEALGVTFRHTIERRIEGARAVGAHKTSMLQDVESGRPLEIDALMLAVLELAEMVGRPAPAIKAVYACVALLNQTLVHQSEPMLAAQS